MEHIIENKLISDAPFYIKFSLAGLNNILKKSNVLIGEMKYSKKYKKVLKHWHKRK